MTLTLKATITPMAMILMMMPWMMLSMIFVNTMAMMMLMTMVNVYHDTEGLGDDHVDDNAFDDDVHDYVDALW